MTPATQSKSEARERSVLSVPKQGLCTGCCICAAICPCLAIRIQETPKGTLEPSILDTCTGCGLCTSICPGLKDFGRHTLDLPFHGFKQAWTGFARSQHVRGLGQSGGCISALLLALLRTGKINGAIVVDSPDDNPLRFHTILARTDAEVLRSTKSKYCPVSYHSGWSQITREDRYVVVGLPCQLHAVSQAIKKKSNWPKGQLVAKIGLICDGLMNFGFQEYILRVSGVNESPTRFVYKDKTNGWPGDLMIETASQGKIFQPNALRTALKHLFRHERCRICVDKLNSSADLVFGDAFLPEFNRGSLGFSVVGTRTEIGESLLKKATEEGTLDLTPLPLEKFLSIQHMTNRVSDATDARLIVLRLNKTSSKNASPFRITPGSRLGSLLTWPDVLGARMLRRPWLRTFFSRKRRLKTLLFAIRFRNRFLIRMKGKLRRSDRLQKHQNT